MQKTLKLYAHWRFSNISRVSRSLFSPHKVTTISLLILFFFGLSSGFPSHGRQQEKKETKPRYKKITSHVFLISISGLRADDLNDPESIKSHIPNLLALKSRSASAVTVESVYPSLTIPAHVTMTTGVLPADHGITSDYPFDDKSGVESTEPFQLASQIKSDTIWAAAKRAGLITAAVGFPMTAGAAIDFNLPINSPISSEDIPDSADTIPIEQSVLKQYALPPDLPAKIDSIRKSESISENKKLKEISRQQRLDNFKTDAAAYIIETYRPNLLMVNFGSYDRAVERYGIRSEESMIALEYIDRRLKSITESIDRAGLKSEATLIVVSDYGSMSIERFFSPNQVLAKKGLLTADGKGNVLSWSAIAQTFGGSAAIFVKDQKDEKSALEIQKVFKDYFDKGDSPIWRIVTQREASQLGADPRAAFYIDAAPSFALTNRADGSTKSSSKTFGKIFGKSSVKAVHGYLPSRSETRAILILSGKGIKSGPGSGSGIDYARLIDITPTIARLFGLEMKTARGRVLSESLRTD